MRHWLTRRWYGDSGPLPLIPFSWLYRGVMALRSLAYRFGWFSRHGAGRPVLVIGNISVGGTGKTPLVAWFAGQLSALGFKVGILSRGYGRRESSPRLVELDSDSKDVGDEPLLLRQSTGCLTVVAADRVAGARLLVEQGADLIITDDGLQHLRLRRDCEIVVLDGARGLGNGHLLPAGPLREPESRLKSVDLIVVNGALEHSPPAQPFIVMKLEPGEARGVTYSTLKASLEEFRGRRVHAVAGIGNPQRFFNALRTRGIDVIEHAFADHHPYVVADLEFGDSLPVLMTEKDAVKCRAFGDARLWYVPVTATFSERDVLTLLRKALRKLGLTAHARGLPPI